MSKEKILQTALDMKSKWNKKELQLQALAVGSR